MKRMRICILLWGLQKQIKLLLVQIMFQFFLNEMCIFIRNSGLLDQFHILYCNILCKKTVLFYAYASFHFYTQMFDFPQEGYHTFRGGFWNYFSMGKYL